MSDDLSDWGDFSAEPVKGSSASAKDDPFADWSNPDEHEKSAKGDQGIGWLDPIKGVAAGVVGDVAAAATGVQVGAEKLGYPGVANAAKGVSRGFHQAEHIIEESESDAFKKSQGAALVPEAGQEQLGSHIGREAVAKSAGVVAPAAVGYAGGTLGAILGSFVGPEGTVAGASAGAAGAGALYGLAKGVDQAVAWTNELSDEELEKEAPVFGKFKQMYLKENIGKGMDPQAAEQQASYDARVALHDGLYGFKQAAIDAGTNAVMFGAGKKLLTGTLGKNFGERAAEYALTGGSMGAASAAGDINQQNVENVKQGTDKFDLGKTAIAFLNGAAEGLAFHGAGEAARKLASYMPQKEVEQPDREDQAGGTPATAAPGTGVTPKQAAATTQPPPNESAQAGEIGNTVNPPTRDQDPTTGKEAAAGAKGKAAIATGKQRAAAEVEGSVTTLNDPAQQAALAQSTPGDPAKVTLVAPKEPNPQVFAAREETPAAPQVDVRYDANNNRIKLGAYTLDVGAKDAIAFIPPTGTKDSVNFYDRDQRKHYGRGGEAYLDEMSAHGVPELLQPYLRGYLKGEMTPQDIVADLQRRLTPTKATPRENEVPEAPPTIEAQLSQFTDKKRDVIRFENIDQVPDDLPKGAKEYEAEDGSVWWYRGKITARQVKKAIKDSTENELLGLGPFNKEDVANDIAAGGQPAAVVARTPEGVETAAAASTDRLADATAEAVQDANPGATVSVEQPQEVIEGRVNGTGKPGRVLEDVSEAGRKAREQADREAARIAAENQKSMQQAEPAGRKRGSAEIAAREHSNKTAEAIIGEHLPDDVAEQNFFDGRKEGAKESRDAIMGRAKRMADAFRDAVKAYNDAVLARDPEAKPDHLAKIPQAVRDNVVSTTDHNAAMLLVAEAARLARIKAPKSTDYQRFVSREKALREGKRSEVVAERRAEGDAALRKDQGDVEAPTGNIADALSTGAKHEIEEQVADQVDKELAASKGEIDTDTSINENFEKDLENARERKVELPGVGERGKKLLEKVSALAEKGATEGERNAAKEAIERVKANAAASVVTAGKDKSAEVGTKIKVETTKRRTIRKPEPKAPEVRRYEDELLAGMDPMEDRTSGEREGHVSLDYGRDAPSIKIMRTERAADLLRKMGPPPGYLAGRMFPIIRQRLIHIAGETKVHFVDRAELERLDGKGSLGVYKPRWGGEGGYVIMAHDVPTERQAHIYTHELLHAATEDALIRSPELKASIKSIMNEAAEALAGKDPNLLAKYGFKNESEFIAEAFSNPEFQRLLAKVQISDKLAKELGVEKRSLWSALVDRVREVLRMPPGAYSALEALIKPTNEAMTRQGRLNQEALARPEARSFIDRDDVTRAGNRAKLSLEAGVEKIKRATLFNTQLVRSARHLGDRFFKSADRANKIFKRMTAERQRILEQEGGADLVREAATLAQARPDAMREGSAIANWAADLQLDPTGAANDHINTKDPSRGGQWWLARKQLPELQAAWTDFAKREPKVADFLERAANWGRDAKNKQTAEMVEKELETAGLGDPALAARILKAGEVPDPDKALFSSQVLVDHINRVVEANGRQGWYFPAIREGDYVVTAKRAFDVAETSSVKRITTDENGEPVSNMVQFTDPTGGRSALKARRAARDWVQSHFAKKIAGERDQLDTLGKPTQVWVDRNDPTRLLDKSDVDAIPAYRVRMQDEYMSLHESKADAAERAEQMRAEGWDEVRDPDLKRLNPNARWGGLIPMQFEAFLNSLRDREKFKDLDAGQQNEMIQALHQTSLKLHPGMRMQHHWVQRKNVMGYQKDIAQAVSRFVTLDAGFRARLRYATDLHEATRDMHNVADEMNDKQNDRRRGIARELEARFYKGEEFQSQTLADRAISKLSQASMVTKLAGPSQPIINSLEPSMVTLPVLAGYHGAVKAARAMKDAYNAIGARGILGAGLRDVAKAAVADHGFTDYREFIKDRIANSGVEGNRAARLGDLIDHLHDLNLFGHEAGMEVQRLTNAETNRFFRAVDRADLMFRQVNQAIEAINRAVTGIAAYELRYAKTKNHFEALDYAHDVVDETMGDYAAANSAPILNSRGGRLAFQFKKYGVKSYGLLGRLAADSFRGDRDAIKAFAGVMVTHGVMAGALGLPGMELVKAALWVPGLMGGYSWDDFQDDVRGMAESMFGKDVGTALTRGAPRALGVDTASRMGWENLVLPRDNPRKPEDITKWLGEAFVGAPGSLPVEVGTAGMKLAQGDWKGALDAQPSKFVRDVYRAAKGLNSGFEDKTGREKLKPYSLFEAGVQLAGFKPGRAAEVQERNSSVYRQTMERTHARREAINAWVNADPDGKARALKAVQDYNQSLPEGAPRILMKDLTSAAKARRTEKIKGTYDEGMRVTKQNRDIVQRAKEIY